MQVQYFTIPVKDSEAGQEDLNKFLRGHKVLEVEQHLVALNNTAFWCVSVEYLTGGPKTGIGKKQANIDYKEVLDEVTFKKYDLLRQCRKEIAELNSIPLYAIFTNEELSKIAGLAEITDQAILNLSGIGSGRMKKFGKPLIESFNLKQEDETGR